MVAGSKNVDSDLEMELFLCAMRDAHGSLTCVLINVGKITIIMILVTMVIIW